MFGTPMKRALHPRQPFVHSSIFLVLTAVFCAHSLSNAATLIHSQNISFSVPESARLTTVQSSRNNAFPSSISAVKDRTISKRSSLPVNASSVSTTTFTSHIQSSSSIRNEEHDRDLPSYYSQVAASTKSFIVKHNSRLMRSLKTIRLKLKPPTDGNRQQVSRAKPFILSIAEEISHHIQPSAAPVALLSIRQDTEPSPESELLESSPNPGDDLTGPAVLTEEPNTPEPASTESDSMLIDNSPEPKVSSDRLSIGSILGIVLVIAFIILITLVACMRTRRRNQPYHQHEPITSLHDFGSSP